MGDIFGSFLGLATNFIVFAAVAIFLGLIVSLSTWVRSAPRWDERAAISILWAILAATVFYGFIAVGAGFWSSVGLVAGASFWGFFSKSVWLFFFKDEPPLL